MPDTLQLSVDDLFKEARRTGRRPRRPQHTFSLKAKPFTIQPFFIAPVLPGETLKNLLLQSRVVTDPLNSRLVGWWCEYYFFYVRMTDLDEYNNVDTFKNLFIDPSASLTAFNAAANTKTYHPGPGIDWTNECLKVVTKEWFREDDEAWNVVTIDGMPAAKVNTSTWMQSLLDETLITEGTAPGAGETEETIEANQRAYEYLRFQQLTDLSYEDWCRTFGVKIPKEQEHGRPELVRYMKDWSYPSNTVDPSTGVPTSAVSWGIQERADKDRYFKQPGFLFGVQVVRPKTYYARQYGAGIAMLDGPMYWLPAVLKDDPASSIREYANNAGPLNGSSDPTNGYLVDTRDLYLYGDQFVNHALSDTHTNFVALPTAALEHLYPSETSVDAMFPGASAKYVYSDGVVSLNILGAQTDQTPRPHG